MPYAAARDSDASLATRWQSGDRQAGSVLIARYFDLVVAELAAYGLGAGARASEVFARVERSLPSLDPTASFAQLVQTHARELARAKGCTCGPLNETVDLPSRRR